MRRAINLVDHFRRGQVESSSSSRVVLINMPMLVKFSFLKSNGISSVPSTSTSGQRSYTFVSYHIYKGRGAICIVPIAPEFCPLNPESIRISKVGSVHLQFAHSVGERKYDWKKKQTFALSATELGSLISLKPNESCEFFHDPFIGKSDVGKVHKVLQIAPLPSPPGYFFRLIFFSCLSKIN
ncbi:single-stranded DNA-binding protein WHY1, chloroplastic isoform X2 [Cryptomeria japonica]|uniref:single-stranded DNA-binding protein WHY1, chloroplastic isoform X2 n=1 Tax=Cryptomeria japonica TaxID=3369 RepID=UPI0025AD76D2|nr:single-stranded DNA-binding protein WHY1, chloroplastic isoform X2 [Cryptomeria japonica]